MSCGASLVSRSVPASAAAGRSLALTERQLAYAAVDADVLLALATRLA